MSWTCYGTTPYGRRQRGRLLVARSAQQIRNFRRVYFYAAAVTASVSSPAPLYDRLSRQSNYMHEHVVSSPELPVAATSSVRHTIYIVVSLLGGNDVHRKHIRQYSRFDSGLCMSRVNRWVLMDKLRMVTMLSVLIRIQSFIINYCVNFTNQVCNVFGNMLIHHFVRQDCLSQSNIVEGM